MIDVMKKKENLELIRSYVELARKSDVYERAQTKMRLAADFINGDQIPTAARRNPSAPALVLNTLATDLVRTAGVVTNGRVETRLYPADDSSKELVPHLQAESRSWQYYEGFKERLSTVAYQTLAFGVGGGVVSVDPFSRVGDDLPRITFQVVDSRLLLVDPIANDPHDPLLGGRFAAVYDVMTLRELEAMYGFFDEFKEEMRGIKKLNTHGEFDPGDSPVRHILERIGIMAPRDKKSQVYLTMRIVWKDFCQFKDQDGNDVVRRCYVHGFLVSDVNDPLMKNAVLIDTAILNYDSMPTIILACTKPPYGIGVPEATYAITNARNMAASAAMMLLVQQVRSGMRMAVASDVWDPEQLTKFRETQTLPDVMMFNVVDMAQRGIPIDLTKVVASLNPQTPNGEFALRMIEFLSKFNEQTTGNPWVMSGQANASSRFSGAAISAMQDAAKLGHELTAMFIARLASNVIKCVLGMIKQHWTSYHNILDPGMTGLEANMIVADSNLANSILRGEVQAEKPLVLTGIRVKTTNENPIYQYKTYTLTPGITDVRDDPILKWLLEQEDVVEVMWVINGLSSISAEVEVLVEVDSRQRDQEDFARYQAIVGVDPQLLCEEYRFRLAMSGDMKYNYEYNQEKKQVSEALKQLAKLPPEQLQQIVAQVQQGQQPQGQPPPLQLPGG